MALKCGIIGLPNVGKSTLFNALTSGNVASANFPFCTIQPNTGIVNVPDQRLADLSNLIKAEKTTPTTLSLVDIAGLVKGASQGEGLGNQFLTHIREVDAVVHMVRCFDDKDILHVANSVDPIFDKQIIDLELQYKDLATLHKKLAKLGKAAKTKKDLLQEQTLVQQCISALEKGQNARTLAITPQQHTIVQDWQLLTYKPVIYVANIDEATLKKGTHPHLIQLKELAKSEKAPIVTVCASLEAQIASLPIEDQVSFLQAYGLTQTSLQQLIQVCYHTLGLITFFTAGPQEVRAWTLPHSTPAPQAAGTIHTDFEKGFIKAEVIKLQDYLHYKTFAACKLAGKIAIEGKDYKVQDGDIIHFKCRT